MKSTKSSEIREYILEHFRFRFRVTSRQELADQFNVTTCTIDKVMRKMRDNKEIDSQLIRNESHKIEFRVMSLR